MLKKSMISSSWGLVLVALTGCASTPPPRATIAQAELAIREAAREGVERFEPALVASARAKYDRAVRDMNNDHNLRARRLAEESLIEARLATARSEAAKQRESTSESREAVDELESEMTRDRVK